MEKTRAAICGILGVLEAGAAYLPIDPKLPPRRSRQLLKLAAPSLILTADQTGFAGLRIRESGKQNPRSGPAAELGEAAFSNRMLAYVMFTSGTTGRPKGVAIDHRGALNTIHDINRAYKIGETARF